MLVSRRRHSAPAQDAILEFIRDYKRSEDGDGNSPTYQQIARAVDRSISTVKVSVLRLVKHGDVKINSQGKIILGGKYIPPE